MGDKETLGLHNLPAPKGAHRDPKRKGRGPGSGLGKTSGRGHKGQRSRTSGNVRPGFEGGQMPLTRRVPKRGFTNPYRTTYEIVNVRDLTKLLGEEVTPETLLDSGVVGRIDRPIKILATGDVERAYVVKRCGASGPAREKIEKAGGRFED